MADETVATAAAQANSRRETLAFVVGVAGWLVPGLGHALLKMWGRALACFMTVVIAAMTVTVRRHRNTPMVAAA